MVELARVPDLIRGFGPIKDDNIEKATEKRRVLLEQLDRSNDGGSDNKTGTKEFLAAAE